MVDIGDKTLRKLELNIRKSSLNEHEVVLKKEISRLEIEVEAFKKEIKKNFHAQFENEKMSMKNVFLIFYFFRNRP